MSKADQQKVLPLLHFQRTVCFGPCPAYSATISTDGTVTFAGFAHVPTTDTLYFKIEPEVMDSINQKISALNYPSLQDLYPTDWTDMPSTITTFYKEGKEDKKVIHKEGGPAELREFQEWLDGLLLRLAETTTIKGNLK